MGLINAKGGAAARQASFWAPFDTEPESRLLVWPLSG